MAANERTSIRDALPSEFEQAARVLHDAFFTSREHRYFAGATAKDPGTLVLGTNKMTTRLRFYLSNVRATSILGGRVRLVVSSDDAIVGVMLLQPPHKRIGISPILLYQSGFGRVFWDWGLHGYKRIVKEWEEVTEAETRKKISYQEEHKTLLLHMLGVHPNFQRKGIGTLLLDDMKSIVDTSTMLYCATTQNRDMYTKNGFVEKGRWRILSGIADEQGWPIEGIQKDQVEAEKETSYLMIMTR